MKQNIIEIYKNIPANVKLIIVTKGIDINLIENLICDHHLIFAENKVQEAKLKWTYLKNKYPKTKLHMIGHLQSNKINDALKLFDSIDTIDSYHLAQKIKTKIDNNLLMPDLKIQIKFDTSELRSGIEIDKAEAFIDYCLNKLKLNITGLMCIPPQNINPEIYFQTTTKLAHSWDLKNISMGMSADYKIAVACGATEIRIGSSIFNNS